MCANHFTAACFLSEDEKRYKEGLASELKLKDGLNCNFEPVSLAFVILFFFWLLGMGL